ncbi:MAG: DUF2207 domain-containing protein [Nitratireductor sp.]|nr:DUF2207 domain-containing protein [Nitratireductor sp.]
MKRSAAALFLLLFLLIPAGALAAEEIRDFLSDITVNADGSLDVVETITVQAEGYQIKRGIYRDIPLRATDSWGLWTDNGFDLRQVLHNGAASPYKTEWQGRFLRIYIGDADVFIPWGEHTYTIRYHTTRQLRYFDDYDELYWNVTGNFWSFPIRKARAVVHLPQGALSKQIAAYTGGYGAAGRDFTASGAGTADIGFETTKALRPNEGMTLAVGFTRGVVAGEGSGAGLYWLWSNLGYLLLVAGWLFVPSYYGYVWSRVGRDPPTETVIPLFHPPENLSPAAMSFVHFNAFKQVKRGSDLAYIAALLSLGVKRMLVIDENAKGKISFTRGAVSDPASVVALPAGERALYNRLLATRETVSLDKRFGPTLQAAQSSLQSAIRREYGGKFFNSNLGWFVPGVIVGVLTFVLGLVLQQPGDDAMASVMPGFFGSLFGCGLAAYGWFLRSNPVGYRVSRAIGAALLLAGALIIAVTLLGLVTGDGYPAWRFAGLLVAVGIVTGAAMLYLLGAPTLAGAKVLPRIEGFKLYLETAETNRLNLRDAPEMSEELYERYLPYAAGLGVEEPWSKAWAAHLARVAPAQEQAYRPAWYHGRSWSSNRIGSATAASVAAVSAAMASAMPAPKSSSGSSGGGFSGGGGGGGGGGGW